MCRYSALKFQTVDIMKRNFRFTLLMKRKTKRKTGQKIDNPVVCEILPVED